MSDVILECRELGKSFDEGPSRVQVLKQVEFALKKGEFAAIIGNSGSGKTTLLHLLSGLDVPSQGQVLIDGKDFSSLSDKQRGVVLGQSRSQSPRPPPPAVAVAVRCLPSSTR